MYKSIKKSKKMNNVKNIYSLIITTPTNKNINLLLLHSFIYFICINIGFTFNSRIRTLC